MSFMNSYKSLEKVCEEFLNDERRVSAYIDEMTSKPNGRYLVEDWEKDLKKLKHYRWVRNKIVHETGCTEKNMCESGDEKWLEKFSSRIKRKEDPLSLYYEATDNNTYLKNYGEDDENDDNPYESLKGVFMLIILLIVLFLIYFCANQEPLIVY